MEGDSFAVSQQDADACQKMPINTDWLLLHIRRGPRQWPPQRARVHACARGREGEGGGGADITLSDSNRRVNRTSSE